MTKDEILSMYAGPEMDRLVFDQIMDIDFRNVHICPGEFSPSTNIADAFEVVEKVRSLTGCFELISPTVSLAWSAGFWIGRRAEADTAPLAICRAALMATQSDYAPEQGIPTEPPAEYPTKEMPQPNTTKR